MVDTQLLLSYLKRRAATLWEHLSATQRLMLQGIGIVTGVLALAALAGAWAPHVAAGDGPHVYTGTAARRSWPSASAQPGADAGEFANLEARRDAALHRFSQLYGVDMTLAELVYETALRQGIDPDLGFRLVHLESQFRERAVSRAGAVGLAQVQLATARFYDPRITTEGLQDPATNVRIGFRFLRDLIDTYGDVETALLAYNWGPSRLRELLAQGRNPRNGYASSIMRGYQGTW
jgi:soluble lytic murein transglycosylase-like protein